MYFQNQLGFATLILAFFKLFGAVMIHLAISKFALLCIGPLGSLQKNAKHCDWSFRMFLNPIGLCAVCDLSIWNISPYCSSFCIHTRLQWYKHFLDTPSFFQIKKRGGLVCIEAHPLMRKLNISNRIIVVCMPYISHNIY